MRNQPPYVHKMQLLLPANAVLRLCLQAPAMGVVAVALQLAAQCPETHDASCPVGGVGVAVVSNTHMTTLCAVQSLRVRLRAWQLLATYTAANQEALRVVCLMACASLATRHHFGVGLTQYAISTQGGGLLLYAMSRCAILCYAMMCTSTSEHFRATHDSFC